MPLAGADAGKAIPTYGMNGRAARPIRPPTRTTRPTLMRVTRAGRDELAREDRRQQFLVPRSEFLVRQRPLDLDDEGRVAPSDRACLLPAEDAVSIDEEGRWDADDQKRGRDSLVRVAPDRVGHAVPAGKRADRVIVASGVDADTDELEPALAVSLVDALELGDLVATRVAPGRPHVQQHGLPTQLLERHRIAFD